jgi:hypothetical protein
VAVALIVLIMAIVSQAFVDGLETFRQLKGIGDLQEELRSAVVPLRNDLLARHIGAGSNGVNRQKLSDPMPIAPNPYLPGEGYFRIQTGSTPYAVGTSVLLEGADSNGLQSFTATNHVLSFTIFTTGSYRHNWMTAGAPYGPTLPTAPQDPSSLWWGQLAPADYQQPPPNSQPPYPQPFLLLSQAAEVCWFLAPQYPDPNNPVQATATPPNGGGAATPLWGLYRRQRLLVPNNPTINNGAGQIASTNFYLFPEVSCKPNGGSLYFNNPADVVQPPRRAFMDNLGQFNVVYPVPGATVYPMGTANGENNLIPPVATSDLVVSNVVSFEVKVLFAGTSAWNYQFMDIGDAQQQQLASGDTTVTVNGVYDTATTPATMYRVMAIQVTLRIWDPKTEQTRQVTMIQDM